MENKKYADMTFTEFIEEVLHITLTSEQAHLANIFNEIKSVKFGYTIPYMPYFKNDRTGINQPIDIRYKTGDVIPSPYEITCELNNYIKNSEFQKNMKNTNEAITRL